MESEKYIKPSPENVRDLRFEGVEQALQAITGKRALAEHAFMKGEISEEKHKSILSETDRELMELKGSDDYKYYLEVLGGEDAEDMDTYGHEYYRDLGEG